jgi:hypothetical protein
VIKEEFDEKGGTIHYGFPLEDQTYRDGKLVQKFETQEISINPCEGGLKWDDKAGECVQPKEWECRQIGMHMYVNPNNATDIICAKINPATYINQYLDAADNTGNPVAGRNMCGANAAVMALNQIGIITEEDINTLKTYTYQENGINSNSPVKCNYVYDWVGQKYGPARHDMYNVSGSFSRVGLEGDCSQASWNNIDNYLKSFGLKTRRIENISAYTGSDPEKYVLEVKKAIDNGGGVIQGVGGGTGDNSYAHIVAVIGYTDDNRFIVNDPYTNLMDGYNLNDYDYSGMGAIYSFENDQVLFTRIIRYKQ